MTKHEDKYRGYGPLIPHAAPVDVPPESEGEKEILRLPKTTDDEEVSAFHDSDDGDDNNENTTETSRHSVRDQFERLVGSFSRSLSIEAEKIKTWAEAANLQFDKKYQPLWNATLQPTQEWNVTLYQEKHSYVFDNGKELVELANIQEGESVLDLGCGSGELTQALYEKSKGRVVGIDSDPWMIEIASEENPDVDFIQADMRDLSFEEEIEPFDVLFSNASFDWIPPTEVYRAAASAVKLLRTGGRIIIELAGKGNLRDIVQVCEEKSGLKGTEGREFWYYPGIGGFTSVLEAHGVEVTSAELFYKSIKLEDGEEGLSNWINMFGRRFIDEVDDPDEFLRAVNDNLREKLFDGKQWTAHYRHLRVVGTKKP